jgi:hypothetical protein
MPAGPSTTPTLRAQVERTSRPLLLRLHGWPRPVLPLLTVVLVLVGVLAPPAVGLAALVVVALFVAWIAYLSGRPCPCPAGCSGSRWSRSSWSWR